MKFIKCVFLAVFFVVCVFHLDTLKKKRDSLSRNIGPDEIYQEDSFDRFVRKVRTGSFYISMGLMYSLIGVPVFLASKFASQKLCFKIVKVLSKICLVIMKYTLGINYKIYGYEELKQQVKDNCFIISPKHESPWELFIFAYLFPDAVFVADIIVFKAPLLSILLNKINAVKISSDVTSNNTQLVLKGVELAKKSGRPVVIYPEGGRIPREKNSKVKSGTYVVSKEFNLDVYPVFINVSRFLNPWIGKLLRNDIKGDRLEPVEVVFQAEKVLKEAGVEGIVLNEEGDIKNQKKIIVKKINANEDIFTKESFNEELTKLINQPRSFNSYI